MRLFEVFKNIKPFPKIKGPQKGSTFRGVTLIADGHTHRFQIRFDRNGKITGGKTLSDDTGHTHQIKRMAQTESSDGHSHKLPIPSGGRISSGGRTPPGGPGSMTGGGTGGGGMTGTGAGTGTPGTGDPGGGNGGM